MKRRFIRKLGPERPTIWIGKEGATEQVITEIDRQLEQQGVVKAKILGTALRGEKTKDIVTRIASQTDSLLVEIRGHTFILYRKQKT